MTIDELRRLAVNMPDREIYDQAKAVFDGVAKPIDGFGDFEDIICRIASIQGSVSPDIKKRVLVIMIADNAVVAEGVSQTDSSVTGAVAALMGKNSSTVGIMTKDQMVDIIPVDMGIDSDEPIEGVRNMKVRKSSGNIVRESAMSREECLRAIEAGISIAGQCQKDGYGIIFTGEMGIGNTTSATALLCALCALNPEVVTGRGAGLSDEGLKRKTDVIKKALAFHGFVLPGSDPESGRAGEDAFRALCSVGGLDIAALAGLFIGAAVYHIPIVIDGMITAVAALAAERIVSGCRHYMIASHSGRERGTSEALSRLGLKSVINGNMALGEGSGGVILLPVIEMILNVYNSGTRFESAKIGQYERFDK